MKKVKIYKIILVFLFLVCFSKGDEGIIFYISFDKSIENADISSGKKEGKINGEVIQVDGIKGKGVIVGEKGSITFDAEKNIDISKGTISFWFSPFDWDSSYEGTIIFIKMDTKDGINVAWLNKEVDRKTWGNTLCVSLYGQDENGKYIWGAIRGRYGSASNIKKNQWYHFLITWDEKIMYIYMNGELQGYGTRKLFRQPDRIHIGPGLSTGNQPQTIIDEVKILNEFLTADEVKKFFKKELPEKEDIDQEF